SDTRSVQRCGFAAVAVHHRFPQVLRDGGRPDGVALDDEHLVVIVQQLLRKVVADLASARHDYVHHGLPGAFSLSSMSTMIRAPMLVGLNVSSPISRKICSRTGS